MKLSININDLKNPIKLYCSIGYIWTAPTRVKTPELVHIYDIPRISGRPEIK